MLSEIVTLRPNRVISKSAVQDSAIITFALASERIRAVSVRRLRDVHRSGWNLLWMLIPLFGSLYLLHTTVQPSDVDMNGCGAREAA